MFGINIIINNIIKGVCIMNRDSIMDMLCIEEGVGAKAKVL